MGKLAAPEPRTGCTNPAHRNLRLAPVPCPDCHGWLDSDGRVMDRSETIARYPGMARQVAAGPPWSLPDYAGPSAGEKAMALSRLAGALARTGLAILFAALALALVVYLIVKLA